MHFSGLYDSQTQWNLPIWDQLSHGFFPITGHQVECNDLQLPCYSSVTGSNCEKAWLLHHAYPECDQFFVLLAVQEQPQAWVVRKWVPPKLRIRPLLPWMAGRVQSDLVMIVLIDATSSSRCSPSQPTGEIWTLLKEKNLISSELVSTIGSWSESIWLSGIS